jgi:hypothetical protein
MVEPIRFYTDENVGRSVASGSRRRGVDVLTVPEADMRGATDFEHLKFATNQGRVLFTQDDDFLRLHAQGLQHSGIVYAHQRTSVGDIIRGLMLIYHVMSLADMQNHVEFL